MTIGPSRSEILSRARGTHPLWSNCHRKISSDYSAYETTSGLGSIPDGIRQCPHKQGLPLGLFSVRHGTTLLL